MKRTILPVAWVAAMILSAGTARAERVGEFDFVPAGSEIPNKVSTTGDTMHVEVNGTGFASANAFGVSAIGDRLGQAGLMTEPAEPASQTNNYGFWAHKSLISTAASWSVVAWFNRRTLHNTDFIFYIGASDGYGGSGPETFVWTDLSGTVGADNWSNGSTLDFRASGGTITAGVWHQVALVNSASTLSLYLDGQQLGGSGSAALNSLGDSSNTFIVFGSAKWMANATGRARVLDGMVDQVEIYDQALTPQQIEDRYTAFVPEPAGLTLLAGAMGLLALRRHR